MFPGFDDFYRELQKTAIPAVWSRGVTLVRGDASVVCEGQRTDEVKFRILVRNQAVSPRVRLFPNEQQWICDCESDDDPCSHVAAAMIAIKQGKVSEPDPTVVAAVSRIEYRFRSVTQAPVTRWGNRWAVPEVENISGLAFDRFIVSGTKEKNLEQKLTQNLRAMVAAQTSGRIPGPQISATKSDFAIDLIVATPSEHPVDRLTLLALLRALENFEDLTLDGQPVRTSSLLLGVQARVIDDGAGWRLLRFQKQETEKRFSGGVILAGGTLHPVEHSKLTPQEDQILTKAGQYFAPGEGLRLASEIIPILQKKIPVEVMTSRLPKTIELPPRVLISTEAISNEELSVVARLVYGHPGEAPLAYVQDLKIYPVIPPGKRLQDIPQVIVKRDENEERQCLQKLSRLLQLQTGRPVNFTGRAALDFAKNLKGWEVEGNGIDVFTPKAIIEPSLVSRDRHFDVLFKVPSGDRMLNADPAKVFRAWRDGADSVPLMEGGWAPLPKDWLRRFGKRVQEMLAARDAAEELPAHRMPELAKVFEEVGQEAPVTLQNLRKHLDHFEGIPEYPLPSDLKASLRQYQKVGVNWLCFLRDSELGGLLADDMGLGKTLQAICALRGRSLVIAPTSVLQNWANELEKFRPGLKVSIYYGGGRVLSADADVVLTTYALARIDQEILVAQNWDTVVLDEAQTIKNPHSQISRAVHRISGKFRISLSGTPVENRLDDLWSQFQFVNPGFLGSYESFQDTFVRPIAKGDMSAAEKLRARVKPFILRRLKRTVAPELPARTETVLRCELNVNEREVYESILAATRNEVVAKLREGGSVIQALEALLRLRQACCHINLVPGQSAESSSKLDLLLETLEESLSEGHRSLIFSQWTSFLDLIQKSLEARNIRFSRIDGSTKNRADVVKEFQDPNGPSLMLLSLKAGGIGLTLTAADHVFIMDPWWNPSVEDQAADRAHRIGQQNPVLIHRLVTQETLEDKILLLQKKKQDLARAVLDGAEGGASLTRQDILDLLS